MLYSIMQSVFNLSGIVLSVIMLNVIMLNVVILGVIMLSVVAPVSIIVNIDPVLASFWKTGEIFLAQKYFYLRRKSH